MNFTIRAGKPEDCKDIERMIMELAVYENMPDQVEISHKELERDGFGPNPYYQCLVAEVPEEQKSKDGYTKVGYALFFYAYSTFRGRVVYIEDLYVMQEYREGKRETVCTVTACCTGLEQTFLGLLFGQRCNRCYR